MRTQVSSYADAESGSLQLVRSQVRSNPIVIINDNALVRECLHGALASAQISEEIASYASVSAWLDEATTDPDDTLVLLCIGNRRIQDGEVESELATILGLSEKISVVIMADHDRIDQIMEAFNNGVRGYIPASVPLKIAVQALNLVRAGGTFVPATSLLSSLRSSNLNQSSSKPVQYAGQDGPEGIFTSRQAAVVKALRQGKANKLIAYELNMRESTVKVHIRNIMRKLNARNRTEVAFRTNALFSAEETY